MKPAPFEYHAPVEPRLTLADLLRDGYQGIVKAVRAAAGSTS